MTAYDAHRRDPLPPPLGRLAWLVLGVLSTLLALVGFVLPILPGVPLLILAGLCFANVSSRVHARLAAVPAMQGVMGKWQRARHAPVGVQIRTACALTVLGIVETLRMGIAALRRAARA